VVKTAYSGTPETFERVVESTSLRSSSPAARAARTRETLDMVRGAMDAGADGVSMGRSIFQHEEPRDITSAVSKVVHDDADAADALREVGLTVEA